MVTIFSAAPFWQSNAFRETQCLQVMSWPPHTTASMTAAVACDVGKRGHYTRMIWCHFQTRIRSFSITLHSLFVCFSMHKHPCAQTTRVWVLLGLTYYWVTMTRNLCQNPSFNPIFQRLPGSAWHRNGSKKTGIPIISDRKFLECTKTDTYLCNLTNRLRIDSWTCDTDPTRPTITSEIVEDTFDK